MHVPYIIRAHVYTHVELAPITNYLTAVSSDLGPHITSLSFETHVPVRTSDALSQLICLLLIVSSR